jgi:hypothetical protein
MINNNFNMIKHNHFKIIILDQSIINNNKYIFKIINFILIFDIISIKVNHLKILMKINFMKNLKNHYF